MPGKSDVAKLTKCIKDCKDDPDCVQACEDEFDADGGTIDVVNEGGKVFTDSKGGKVFITKGGKVF